MKISEIDPDGGFFCVWAYRYGESQSYNFPVGMFQTYEEAERAAESHRLFRGYKYDHKIFQLNVGHLYDAEEAPLVRGFKSKKE